MKQKHHAQFSSNILTIKTIYMKKITFLVMSIMGLQVFSQNTIPTTTVNGALEIRDSLTVTNDITAKKDLTIMGEILAQDTLRAIEYIVAEKDIKVGGSIYLGNELNVTNKSTFNKDVLFKQSILFDSGIGISMTPLLTGNRKSFRYGLTSAKVPEGSCAAAPTAWANHQFGGLLQIFDADPITGDYVQGTGLLNLQTWSGGSSIDASIGGSANGGGLLLNYFCGNNTFINTGQYGGKVSMGNNVEIGMPIENLSFALNMNLGSGQTKAINVVNPLLSSANKTVFEVSSTGKTNIGIGRPKVSGVAANAMLSVDGLILAKEVRVAVSSATHWADYVFESTYKLKNLYEVEKFINQNKHLPEVPSANEVAEKGIDMLEINSILLKKIEELTLYSIELKKQIDALQAEISNIKSK